MKWIILFGLLGALLYHGYAVHAFQAAMLADGMGQPEPFWTLAIGSVFGGTGWSEDSARINGIGNLGFGLVLGAALGLGIRLVKGPDKPATKPAQAPIQTESAEAAHAKPADPAER